MYLWPNQICGRVRFQPYFAWLFKWVIYRRSVLCCGNARPNGTLIWVWETAYYKRISPLHWFTYLIYCISKYAFRGMFVCGTPKSSYFWICIKVFPSSKKGYLLMSELLTRMLIVKWRPFTMITSYTFLTRINYALEIQKSTSYGIDSYHWGYNSSFNRKLARFSADCSSLLQETLFLHTVHWYF